ncbi:NADP-dependent oxidoreductase [Haloferax sp. S1W]|uniref:NADP-dependent oxidoreductase n=1 Tax=Haloferax sp. S1W TaxID=3377110 RepID=UPI0037C9BBCE
MDSRPSTTMQAIQLQNPNGTAALASKETPRPQPADDELLVRTHAAGVNPLDWLICDGHLRQLLDEPLPWIPGWDISGVVESVGADVSGFEAGDTVYGMVRLPGAGGAFAEYATVKPHEVTSKPARLSHTEAAGVPMVGQTAFHALFEEAGVDADDRILIHAAAGGVGHMAVQFAADAGLRVIGTASERNEAYLRELGVDEFIDYRNQRFEDEIEPVDVVLDAVGGSVLERSAEVVRPGGVVVTLPEQPPEPLVETLQREYDAEISFFSVTDDAAPSTLQRVTERIDAGAVEPTIRNTYPLSEAQTALEKSATGHVRGKLVLTVEKDE